MSLFLHATDDGWNPGSEGFCQQQFYHPIEMLMNLFCHEAALRATPSGCLLSVVMSFLYVHLWYDVYIYVYYIIQSTISCVSLYAHLIFDQTNHGHEILISIFILPSFSSIFPNVSPRCLVSGACRCLAWTAEATWLCCGPWCGGDVFAGELRHGSFEGSREPGFNACWLGARCIQKKIPPNEISTHFDIRDIAGVNIPGLQIIIRNTSYDIFWCFFSVPDSTTQQTILVIL